MNNKWIWSAFSSPFCVSAFFADNIRFGPGMLDSGGSSEMAETFSALFASEQQSAIAGGTLQDQLIESHALSSCLDDPLPSHFWELQSTDSHFVYI